jgi:glycerol-1-phosphate dehydrogenase [NAD(P)+]
MTHGNQLKSRTCYGRDLLVSLPRSFFENPVVLTQPLPWNLVASHFSNVTAMVHMVQTMDISRVNEITSGIESGSAVFGIGGGMSLDHAKYVAWKKHLPLILVPTILSVDAAWTKSAAVREQGRVKYAGEVIPEYILVDYGLLRTAPEILNRSGAGDILSIFTALKDWKDAHDRTSEPYDEETAEKARNLLDRLFAGVYELRDVTDHGLRLLSELYIGEVDLCERTGNSRPEEGSEHYFAYCHESLTKRTCIHGTLVSLGVLIAGLYQGQDIKDIVKFLHDLSLDVSPESIGTTREEVLSTLLHMSEYVRQEIQLLPGIFHFSNGISEKEAGELMDALKKFLS